MGEVNCKKKGRKHIQNPILLHLINGSTKAIQACLKNLQKHVTTQKKAFVEDVTDEEDTDYNPAENHGTADLPEEGFFFLDEGSDSDSEFHRAVLGRSKVPLSHKPQRWITLMRWKRMREHVSTMCPIFKSNSLDSLLSYQLLSNFVFYCRYAKPVLSTLTHRVCQVPRLRGQIGSIMVIDASLLIFSLT